MAFDFGKVYPLENGDVFFAKRHKLYKIPRADVPKFNAFRNGFIISLAISAIIYSFFPTQIRLILLLGICSYFLIMSTFHSRILPKYITMNQKDQENLELMMQNQTTPPIWKLFSIILAGVIIIISSFFIHAEQTQQVILIIFGMLLTFSGSNALLKHK